MTYVGEIDEMGTLVSESVCFGNRAYIVTMHEKSDKSEYIIVQWHATDNYELAYETTTNYEKAVEIYTELAFC